MLSYHADSAHNAYTYKDGVTGTYMIGMVVNITSGDGDGQYLNKYMQ